MISFPQIDPVLIAFGPVQIRWYGCMYVLAIFFAFWILSKRAKENFQEFSDIQMRLDLISSLMVGVILGGRLGYVIFYGWDFFKQDPWWAIRIWEPGMSFHGGFLGVSLSLYFFSKKNKISFWKLSDFIIPCVPVGLGLGRIGNFINGELWGKPSGVFWGMIFPSAGDVPRHPSQIYEALGEGLFLYICLSFFEKRSKNRKKVFENGFLTAIFLIGYGEIRTILEFFREPDPQYGYFFGWITMGQLLSFPMIVLGVCLLCQIFLLRQQKEEVS